MSDARLPWTSSLPEDAVFPWTSPLPETWRARPALINGNLCLSYAGVERVVACWTQLLRESGCGAERPVAAYGLPPQATICLMLAAWRCGAAFAPINHHVPVGQLAPFAEELGPSVLCVAHREPLPDLWRRWDDKSSVLSLVCDDAGLSDSSSPSDGSSLSEASLPHASFQSKASLSHASLQLKALGLLIFTSGSSGRPKIVATCIGDLAAAAASAARFYSLHADDRWLVPLPLFHIGGLMAVLRMLSLGGAAIFVSEGTSLVDVMEEQTPSLMSLVPTQLFRVLQDQRSVAALRRCRAIVIGGAAMPMELLQRCRDLGLPLSLSYGASETSAQIAALPAGDFGDSYQVMPGRELRIHEGRVAVRGAGICAGYWQAGKLQPAVDEQGWLCLQDQAHLTPEGRLQFLGRLDGLFKVGGEQISPADIENSLQAAGIRGFCAVVPEADPEYGQRPVLVIWDDARPDIAALQAMAQSRLMGLQRPRHYYWVPCQSHGLPFKTSRRLAADLLADKAARLAAGELVQLL